MKKQILLLTLILSFSLSCSKNENEVKTQEADIKEEAIKSPEKKAETKTAVKKAEKPKASHSSYETKRLKFVKENGLPKEYKNLEINLANADLKAGEKLFTKNCSSCHGLDALGNTPAGKFLKPPASNLTLVVKDKIATENYLFWAISEGGAKIKSAMPSFKKKLTENERKEIIKYLKNLGE